MTIEPSSEEKWRKMLTEGEPIGRHIYHLFGMLPSNPRCKLCAAPFKSWGGTLMRMIGREQSKYNPRFCQPCERFDNPGGAEIELSMLVPEGRTHRLSVVVAGMLQYALEIAIRENKDQYIEENDYVAMSLIDATETWDPENVKGLLHNIVIRLFDDANVRYERVSKRGEHYTITNSVYQEYLSWYDYPWE